MKLTLPLPALSLALATACSDPTPAEPPLPPPGLAGSPKSASASAPPSADGSPKAPSALAALSADAKVLTVNDVDLTRADLEQAMVHQATQLGLPPGELPPEVREMIEGRAYEGLIERELLRQEAQRRGFEAPLADVEAEKQRLLAQLPPGRTFADVLRRMRTDEATFLRDLRADLSIRRLMGALQKEVPVVDEAAAQRIYEANRARYAANETATASHILIALAPDAPAATVASARERAEQVRAEVNGKDAATFARVAKEQSDDARTKGQGGALGTFERREVLPQIGDVAFRLKKGEVSGLVRSDRGFHILFGQGVTRREPLPFESVKARILAIEGTEARLRFEEDLLAGLRAKATIVRHHEPPPSPLMQDRLGTRPQGPPGHGVTRPPGRGAPGHGELGSMPHGLPPPTKDNVLPGVVNPHAPAADGLKLRQGDGDALKLEMPAGKLGTP